ncbi:MAG: hypothetical protein A2014_01235 [Spirochaetes bacterium GWF1_49_6]|nr:MAG: hypothetical protein A2014_01235 [Spirochaetes bacterium GWF1_49_6]
MKMRAGIIFLLLLTVSKGFSLYFDWSLRDSLNYIYFAPSTNTNSTSAMLINNAGLYFNLYLDDKKYLSFGLSDYYMYSGTNGTNQIFIDKLFVNYTGDNIQFILGRNYFKKMSGLVIAGKGDGLNFKAVLFGTEIDLLVLYYGLLPNLINSFEFNPEDQIQGAQRYTGGITISRYDLIGEKLSMGFFYCFDTTTNNTRYQPFFIELYNMGSFSADAGYRFSAIYQGGQNEGATISAFGTMFDFLLKITSVPKAGMIFSVGYSTGGSGRTNTYPIGNTTSQDTLFYSPGYVDTGIVLFPKFSNLFLLKLSGFIGFGNVFTINVNALMLNKAVADCPISDTGANLTNSYVGTELSILMKAHLDYSMDLILSAGVFLKGEAYSDQSLMMKIYSGVNIKI